MRNKVIIIIFLLVFCFFNIRAEQLSLTLDEAVKLAIKNNPDILQEIQKVKQAKNRKNLGISAMLPSVSFSGRKIIKEKVIVVEFPSMIPGEPPTEVELDMTKNYEFTLQFAQPVFTGGKLLFGLKSAKQMEKAEKSLLISKKNEIKAKTKSIFYSIILLNQSKKIVDNGLKLAKDIEDKIRVMYEEGMTKKLDLLRAENRVREMKAQKDEVISQIFEAKNQLKNILHISLDKNINVIGVIEEVPLSYKSNLLEKKLIANNPVLKSFENQLKASKLNLKSKYSDLIPNFSLGAQYNFRGDVLGDFSDWTSYYSIALNLSIPIFQGFSKKYNIALAKAQKNEVELQSEKYKNQLLAELKNTIKRSLYLKQKIQYSKANFENTKEEFNIARTTYEEGMLSYTDLEQIQNKYLSSQLNYFQSIYEFYTNIFKVETLISEELFKEAQK